MTFWTHITSLGDAGLMIPAALMMVLWLLAMRARGAAGIWALVFAAAALVVAATKIAFIGWGIGIHRLNFTGFSGHSMMSMAVLPILFYLLAGPSSRHGRLFAAAGAVCAVLVGVSRVVLHHHSPWEVITGLLLGGAVSGGFLFWVRRLPPRPSHLPVIAVGLLAVILMGYGRPAPSQDLITRLALELSGRQTPMTRNEWWAEGWRRLREAKAHQGPPTATTN